MTNRLETKDEIYQILKNKGFNISDSRFPYTYHHDYVRDMRPGTLSISDVASKLHEVCKSEQEYIYSCIYLSILYLIRVQPELVDHEVVDILKFCRLYYKELNK